MKNFIILAMILIAGFNAYPQATRSARETKSDKGTERKETVARSTRQSEGNKAVRQNKVSESKSAGRETERKATESKSVNRAPSAAVRQPAAVERKAAPAREEAIRYQDNRKAVRTEQNRTVREPERKSATVRSESGATRVYRPEGAVRREAVSDNKPEIKSGNSVTRTERSATANDREIKVNSNSATRIYREGRGTLTRNDGTVIRHQNDEVFKSKKYKIDFDNYENLRRSDHFRTCYRDYDNWWNHRHVRIVNHYHTTYVPMPWEMRRMRYYHRMPHHIDLIWTPLLFHRFMYFYPTHLDWNIEFGSTIETISAWEARDYAGTVKRVYGKVDEVYYSPEEQVYILYIGAPFPYQDLSVVVPKHIARQFTGSPRWYFEDEYVWVVGLINYWDGKPEIVVRDEDQIRRY